jgi:hypothetical protein
MLTALFTFQDMNEAYHSPPPYEEVSSTSIELAIPLLRTRKSSAALPVRPPKPEPRTGVDRIAEMQSYKGEVNEVMVEEEGSIDDYGKYCWNLLQVCLIFITIENIHYPRMTPCCLLPFVLPPPPRCQRFYM